MKRFLLLQEVKYLGVRLDRKINFRGHITVITKKALAAKGIIGRYTHKAKVQVYRTYVEQILPYADPAWCLAAESHFRKLQVIDNTCLTKTLARNRMQISNRQLYKEINLSSHL